MASALRNLLRVTYAPGMLLIFIGLAIAMMSRGLPHQWLIGLLTIAIIVSLLAERAAPYEHSWNRSQNDTWRDFAHAFVNETSAFAGVFVLPMLTTLLPWNSIWPSHWPIGLQLLIAILIADCGITFMHWLSHRWSLLWRFHAVHHSVTRFYGFNGLLKHPLHQLIETAAGITPLILLGMSQHIAALLAFSIGLQLLLQHSNVDMRIGVLRHVLALAPVHRFHHRKWASVGDVNFGLFTTLWDHLLRTAVFEPKIRFGPGDFGIGSQPDYPRDYFGQLLEPFRRQQIAAETTSVESSASQ